MDASSPYGPDRSLLHAVLVLLGGLGMVAAGAYLLTAIDGPASRWDQDGLAEASGDQWTPPSRRTPVSRGARGSRRGSGSGGGSGPIGMNVPAWAGSARQFVPSGPSTPKGPQSSYDIRPDFGHAQLGSSVTPAGGGTGGAAIAEAGSPGESGPTGRGQASSSVPDMGGRSFGGAATVREAPQWRSEAQALASRTRALSNTLGRIDQQGSRKASRSRSEDTGNESSGEATTASDPGAGSTSAPDTPGDPPQVPLGGTEWLAAAGAAYALNRLRDDGPEEADESGRG